MITGCDYIEYFLTVGTLMCYDNIIALGDKYGLYSNNNCLHFVTKTIEIKLK